MPMNILHVQNLTISYGAHVAVDDISFDVKAGDLLGIVGPNGSGKTTLFRAIFGAAAVQRNHKPLRVRT